MSKIEFFGLLALAIPAALVALVGIMSSIDRIRRGEPGPPALYAYKRRNGNEQEN